MKDRFAECKACHKKIRTGKSDPWHDQNLCYPCWNEKGRPRHEGEWRKDEGFKQAKGFDSGDDQQKADEFQKLLDELGLGEKEERKEKSKKPKGKGEGQGQGDNKNGQGQGESEGKEGEGESKENKGNDDESIPQKLLKAAKV